MTSGRPFRVGAAALAALAASSALAQSPPANRPATPSALGAPRTPDQARAEFRVDPGLSI